jgi:hypothetical protein
MELEALKSAWNSVEAPPRSSSEIKLMLSENNHPVLKGIRRQLTIEITLLTIFLICYYTMFDGQLKPLLINAVLIATVLAYIIHNLVGYRFAKHLDDGSSIKESLSIYLSKIKKYAVVSIMLRLLFAAGLLIFFTYNINFNPGKYLSLALLIGIFTIQVIILYKLWAKRVTQLKNAIEAFN